MTDFRRKVLSVKMVADVREVEIKRVVREYKNGASDTIITVERRVRVRPTVFLECGHSVIQQNGGRDITHNKTVECWECERAVSPP